MSAPAFHTTQICVVLTAPWLLLLLLGSDSWSQGRSAMEWLQPFWWLAISMKGTM
jgi:hypothetical protein